MSSTSPLPHRLLPQDTQLHPLHREAEQRLAHVLQALPSGAASISLGDEREKYLEVRISPSAPGAAQMRIYFDQSELESPDPPSIVICAGVDAAIDVVDLQYDRDVADITAFFEDCVRAIIGGEFRETLFYRGRVLYKSRCELGTAPDPVKFTRTNVPNWLSTLGRRAHVRSVYYASY